MGSSDRLFNRQRSVHQILGGGVGKSIFSLIKIIYSLSLFNLEVNRILDGAFQLTYEKEVSIQEKDEHNPKLDY